jgi:hypothetical protein
MLEGFSPARHIEALEQISCSAYVGFQTNEGSGDGYAKMFQH